jgi:hypothetical protein
VADRYGKVFAEIDAGWKQRCSQAVAASAALPTAFPDAADEQLRQALYGPTSPCTIPDEPIANIETLMDSDSINQIWNLQNELDRWLMPQPESSPRAAWWPRWSCLWSPRGWRRCCRNRRMRRKSHGLRSEPSRSK